jgi:hypothetical protein
MNNINKYVIFPLLGLTLSGCSLFHMSKEACMATNWYQVGLGDGLSGVMPRSLVSAVADCSKFNITVDQAGYEKGWHTGVIRFCTYDKGYSIGIQGLTAPTVCPQNLQQQFSRGWNAGVKEYCNYDRGLSIGSLGQSVPLVCSSAKYASFMEGWHQGIGSYCSNPSTAFNLGKGGQPFPDACASYAQFRFEYDRGTAIFHSVQAMEEHRYELREDIHDEVRRYHLVRHGRYYELGDNKSPEAVQALERVNRMVEKSHDLRERQEFVHDIAGY